MHTQTILITGGSGFAGSHLVDHLLLKGFLVSQIHITQYGSSASQETTPNIIQLPAENIHTIDLTDEQETQSLFQRVNPTQVYHLAALAAVGSSFTSPSKVLLLNTQLQINVLEAIKTHCPNARTLIIGSAQEYDFTAKPPISPVDEEHPLGPANPYGVSKVDQDLLGLSYFYSYGIPVIRARPFNHIGERQTTDFAVAAFAKQIADLEKKASTESDFKPSIQVGNLSAVRDFTDVKDMVTAYSILMEKGLPGEVYNIGSGSGTKMHDILEMLLGLSELQIRIVVDQAKLRPIDTPQIVANASKIRKLGWQPSIPLHETVQRIIHYWREQS